MSEHADPPVIEVTIAAPVEVVWQSLREPDLIKAWHGWHCDSLDAEVQMIFLDNVDADDETHTLRAGGEDTFTCDAVPEGTCVRITRPPYRPGEEWSAYYDDVTEGWRSFLQQLRFLHEVHPGDARRTVALMGEGAAAAAADLWSSTPAPLGDDWYVSDSGSQRGVLVPSLGPGLLIILTKATVDDQVFAMAVLTTFGLDDVAFDSERDAWTAWWRTAFPAAEAAQV